MKMDRLNFAQLPVLFLLLVFMLLINGNHKLNPEPRPWVWHYSITPAIPGHVEPYPEQKETEHSINYFIPIQETVWDFHPNRFPGKHGFN